MRSALQTVVFVVGLALVGTARGANPGEQALPTLQEIFPKIVERAKAEADNDRKFDTTYEYVRSKVTEYRNGEGEVKKRESKTSTNNPALRRTAPEVRPPRARPNTTALSATNSNVRGRQFDQDEFLVNRDLLKRFDFSLVGRESLNQRSMLIIDFQPKQGKLPERNLKDKFINRAAGRVWLDEEDYALAKADLRLTDRVNVLGGLVGAIWKFSYGFERERTPDGLWFTREEKWHLEGREVLFERIMDFHAERTGVHKPAESPPPQVERATARR